MVDQFEATLTRKIAFFATLAICCGIFVQSVATTFYPALTNHVFSFSFYAILLLALYFTTDNTTKIREWLGPISGKNEVTSSIALGLASIGISVFCFCAIWIPVSYLFPEVVQTLISQAPPPPMNAAEVGLILTITTTVLLAPVVEEIVFRGFLLRRWGKKFGTKTAIFASSVLFGILHTDILGTIIFGILLSAITLRTRSLAGPMLVHISHNAIAVILMYCSPSETTTIQEIQSAWPIGVLGLVVGAPFVFWYFKYCLPRYQRVA